MCRAASSNTRRIAPDLIVMCTHGHGGLRRWLFGSNAQKVIALEKTPILLIPPTQPSQCRSFSARALSCRSTAMPITNRACASAIDLAQVCQAAHHLVLVIPTLDRLKGEDAATGQLLPRTMTALLDMQQEEAAEYLGCHIVTLREAGLTVTAEVARGDAVTAIVAAVKRTQANLIAMGTHGKTGMDAFWSGSLTPVIADRSPVPLLLVPIRTHT